MTISCFLVGYVAGACTGRHRWGRCLTLDDRPAAGASSWRWSTW
ncbi:hypothetical protein ACU4GD_40515 [Cupriavidus basilensis]